MTGTEELIRTLSREIGTPAPRSPVTRVWIALGMTVPFLMVLVVAFAGVRPDFADALSRPNVLLKFIVPALLAVAGLIATVQLVKPETRHPSFWMLIPGGLLLLAGVMGQFLASPVESWFVELLRPLPLDCIGWIVGLSLAPLVGVLWSLRAGATTRPMLAGAAAGVLAGSLAAGLYAMHCQSDAPLYLATWYMAAILIVAGLGALLGRQLLTW